MRRQSCRYTPHIVQTFQWWPIQGPRFQQQMQIETYIHRDRLLFVIFGLQFTSSVTGCLSIALFNFAANRSDPTVPTHQVSQIHLDHFTWPQTVRKRSMNKFTTTGNFRHEYKCTIRNSSERQVPYYMFDLCQGGRHGMFCFRARQLKLLLCPSRWHVTQISPQGSQLTEPGTFVRIS